VDLDDLAGQRAAQRISDHQQGPKHLTRPAGHVLVLVRS
jgi:hypothetical protein